MFTFCFFFIILDRKSFIKIKHNILLPIFIYGITVHTVAHPGGVSGVETPLLELKKQQNFVDINSL